MTIGLAAFDMDGTLLQGRFALSLARIRNVEKEITNIQATESPGIRQTQLIANLFKDASESEFLNALESVPLTRNCVNVVSELKQRGFVTGIISDSYTIAASHLGRILDMDFVVANDLDFVDGRATGKVTMPMGWEKIGCNCRLSVCKRYHLENSARRFDVPIANTIAIGDTKSDVCMINSAGLGIAFMPKDKDLSESAKYVINDADFRHILSPVNSAGWSSVKQPTSQRLIR
jgi:phosphoserine phosphatase